MVLLVVSACGAMVARILRQPLVLGYLVSGLVGSYLVGVDVGGLKVYGQLGVTLLLFLVGLELPIRELKKAGKSVLVAGITQVVVSATLGAGVGVVAGFDMVTAMYLGIAVSFGSTVIVVKYLTEQRDLQSLYGRVATGILLVQDFVAIGVLAVVSGGSLGNEGVAAIMVLVIKAVMVGVVLWAVGNYLLPMLYGWAGSQMEVWFGLAVAWCLGVAVGVSHPVIGLSPELGGFLAGVMLALKVDRDPIVARVKVLRDFFLMQFFVLLGFEIGFVIGAINWWLVMVLVILVVIINPLIVMMVLVWLNYSRRIAFWVGITIAQISEFSLILMGLASRKGQIDETVVGTIGAVAVLSVAISSYYVKYAGKLYLVWNKVLKGLRLNPGVIQPTSPDRLFKPEVVLFGCSRMGRVVLPRLVELGKVLVVDFDPVVLESLEPTGVESVYGDVGDKEFLNSIEWDDCRLVVSTPVDLDDSLRLVKFIKDDVKKNIVIIVAGSTRADAEALKAAGADQVVVAREAEGLYLAKILSEIKHG